MLFFGIIYETIFALLIDKINELFEYQETFETEGLESYYSTEFIHNKTLYTVLNIITSYNFAKAF